VPPVYQSSRLPSPYLHPPCLHSDLFSSRSFTTLPTNTNPLLLPKQSLTTDNTNFLKHAFFWATTYATDLISTTQLVTLPLTMPSVCVCVCVSLSLSLPLSLAHASERASELSGSQRAPRERKRAKRFGFVCCKDIFCFSADRGSWLALLTGLVSQSKLTPINYFQYFYIYTLILYFN
jgi:hypothetical protein